VPAVPPSAATSTCDLHQLLLQLRIGDSNNTCLRYLDWRVYNRTTVALLTSPRTPSTNGGLNLCVRPLARWDTVRIPCLRVRDARLTSERTIISGSVGTSSVVKIIRVPVVDVRPYGCCHWPVETPWETILDERTRHGCREWDVCALGG
jgi:hypothetical protein